MSKVAFALAIGLCCAAYAAAEAAGAQPEKMNAILCKTEDQAIAFAANRAAGQSEPIAINLVNKQAGSEVCGRYIGYALVEIEKTENRGGHLFMLAGIHFVEDNAFAWTASWVAPFDGAQLSRGI